MNKNKTRTHWFWPLIFFVTALWAWSNVHAANAVIIDVGLGDNLQETRITATTPYRLINKNTGGVIGDFDALAKTDIFFNKGALKILSDYKSIGTFSGPLEIITSVVNGKKALVGVGNKWYRGDLKIFASAMEGISYTSKGFTVVNQVELEEYLKGVVPNEMPSGWHAEALRAQAICARTYTLSKLDRRRALGYDLKNTTEDQVYGGFASEKKTTNDAIKATKDEVLIDRDGQIIEAYYSSSAGGYTDSIQDVWGLSPKPYLVPRKDYDEDSPHYSWKRSYTQGELTTRLSGLDLGTVYGLSPVKRTRASRVSKLLVTGSKGEKMMTGEEVRHLLSLPSTKFNLGLAGDKLTFAGRGFGHGLGLSQYGTKALAEKGYKYSRILTHYYPTTKLASI